MRGCVVKIAVTGASGFIGQHLCRLLLMQGHEVVALSRREWEFEFLSPQEERALQSAGTAARLMRHVVPEMSAETDFRPYVEGTEGVVHLAGRAHVLRDDPADSRRLFQAANVELPVRVGEAARQCGVSRFVFLSSIGVMGNRTEGTPFLRSSRPSPQEGYAVSKREAERQLQSLFAGENRLVIIRPPLVYGAGARGNFRRLISLVDRLPVLPFGAVSGRRSFIHVRNLCSFIEHCLAPSTPGGTYLVCDEECVPLPELMRLIAGALGKKRRLLPVPLFLLRLAGWCTGRGKDMGRLLSELQINNREDRSMTGWKPTHSLKEGIREMVEHYLREQKARRPTVALPSHENQTAAA